MCTATHTQIARYGVTHDVHRGNQAADQNGGSARVLPGSPSSLSVMPE